MLRRTEGIVLRTVPYGDADLIVTFLTADFGIVPAFAKSPRKTKSRFGSSLEPMTCSVISLMGREDAALPRLTQADILKPFQSLRDAYGRFLMCSELLELTAVGMPEGKPNPQVYALLKSVLGLMDESAGTGRERTYALAYKVRFLGIKGYSPNLGRGCVRCGDGSLRFSIPEGALICDRCSGGYDDPAYHGGVIRLSAGAIRLFETMAGWDLSQMRKLRPSAALLSELSSLMDAHIARTFSRRLRTRDALASRPE